MFRSCRRGALRFAPPLRSPARYGLGLPGALANARREDILSLCLSKEKEPKRNDTREGKIAISSPPETYPNGNAQEGSAPLESPPGGPDSPGVAASPRFSLPGGDEPRPYMGTGRRCKARTPTVASRHLPRRGRRDGRGTPLSFPRNGQNRGGANSRTTPVLP